MRESTRLDPEVARDVAALYRTAAQLARACRVALDEMSLAHGDAADLVIARRVLGAALGEAGGTNWRGLADELDLLGALELSELFPDAPCS